MTEDKRPAFRVKDLEFSYGKLKVLIKLALIFGIELPLFMYTMGLDTQVRESGVFVRFWPFHRKWVVFGFDSIQKVEASTYSPLRDYGG